jgi:hypothetical protein
VTQQVTRHAGLEAGGDGVDGARLGPERADDLRHSREEVLFVFFFLPPTHTHIRSKFKSQQRNERSMVDEKGSGNGGSPLSLGFANPAGIERVSEGRGVIC